MNVEAIYQYRSNIKKERNKQINKKVEFEKARARRTEQGRQQRNLSISFFVSGYLPRISKIISLIHQQYKEKGQNLNISVEAFTNTKITFELQRLTVDKCLTSKLH